MASMWPPKKNTAFTLYFTLYKNDGTVIANPGTLTRAVSVDGGAVDTTPVNAVTEEDTTYGQLSWVLDATEMNGDAIWLYCKDDTTGCVPFTCTLYTTANTQDEIGTKIDTVDNFLDDELAAITAAVITNAAGTDIAADIIALKAVADTIQADTDLLDDAAGGLADIHTDLAGLITDVGANGSGLTAIPWNAAWDAEVQSECDDAITASGIKGATFDTATDSLEALRNRGDAAWATATGFATPTNITAASGITLAASQHVIVDSGTVTTLTNLPAITAGWLTATGIAAGALDGKGNWNIGKTGYALTTAPPTAAEIVTQFGTGSTLTACATATGFSTLTADDVHDEAVEGALTFRQITRIVLAILAGKSAGGGTATITFQDAADTKARVTATADTDGNRTAITLDGTV